MVIFCRKRSDELAVQPTTSTPILISNLNWSADEDKTYLVNSAMAAHDIGASRHSHTPVANSNRTCDTCIRRYKINVAYSKTFKGFTTNS